jgi:hypothetical protein
MDLTLTRPPPFDLTRGQGAVMLGAGAAVLEDISGLRASGISSDPDNWKRLAKSVLGGGLLGLAVEAVAQNARARRQRQAVQRAADRAAERQRIIDRANNVPTIHGRRVAA